MTLFDKLMSIKNELDNLSNNALKEGLDIKLDRIERKYNNIIEANCNYILSRSNYKVFKALNRYAKKEKLNVKKSIRGFIESI